MVVREITQLHQQRHMAVVLVSAVMYGTPEDSVAQEPYWSSTERRSMSPVTEARRTVSIRIGACFRERRSDRRRRIRDVLGTVA